MKKTTLLLCLTVLGPACYLFPQGPVRVAAFEYPPLYQNAADPGLSCEIVVEAFKAAGLEAQVRFYPVSRMVQMVITGEAMCGIGGRILFAEDSAQVAVEFGSIINYVSQGFLYDERVVTAPIDDRALGDLKGYRIGVLAGSGIMRFLEGTPGLHLVTNLEHEGTAMQLHSRRVDLWAIVDLTGLMYVKQLFPDEVPFYRFTKPFHNGDVSVVFSKISDPAGNYRQDFERGLTMIKKNGTYMEILAKYYKGFGKINRNALALDMRK